ncbi:hypothetical protein D7036_13275 [Aquimarina sp. BL5]|uniref:hypothetical protein n=1 Tax=Aquimarina sp. BL5 TaxID=1714860 RepID=UPI000EAA7C41|nr:hypothetical protein [Aquimarina sp. BL5]RKN03745.1 hypothetical protein D7036_13275 [Aquimarina sp. BL5]
MKNSKNILSKVKKNLKIILILLIIIIITVLFYSGYENYKTNELIRKKNSSFSDAHSKFLLPSEGSNIGQELLKEIEKIKLQTINQFLDNSEEKIVFNPLNMDTLSITILGSKYSYQSSLDLGYIDEGYNQVLTKNVFEFIRDKGIVKIDIFSLTPTPAGDVPLPPGYLTNDK